VLVAVMFGVMIFTVGAVWLGFRKKAASVI